MMRNSNDLYLASSQLRSFLFLLLTTLLYACSTPAPLPTPKPVPLVEAVPAIPEDKGGLVLLTATIRNDLAPDYQPDALFVRIQKSQPPEKPELLRFNVLPTEVIGKSSRTTGKTYFLRFNLDPGSYRILGINISAGEFPVRGFGFMPIHADFTVPVGGNFYLGNILGVVRQRQGNEYRIGPATPQVDQSVTGLSVGTFDVSVQDRYEQDVLLYRSHYPEIKDRQIEKSILPPIDRQRAQTYWEEQ